MDRSADLRINRMLVALLWSVPLCEMLMRETYHRNGQARSLIIGLVLGLLLSDLALWLLKRRDPGRWDHWAPRAVVMVAASVAIAAMVGRRAGLAPWQLGGAVLALLWPLSATLWRSPESWQRARRAIAVGLVVFLVAQPIMAKWIAPLASFPPRGPQGPTAAAAPPGIQVMLLLDELSAGSAPSLVNALSDGGLSVAWKPVTPVARDTINVIPEMLTGRPFPDAKPCWIDTLCSGDRALDFSRLRATRPDIDVVGFYHPYCAMAGLRSCDAVNVREPLFSADWWLWRCRTAVLVRWWNPKVDDDCRVLRSTNWDKTLTAFETAVLEQPVWEAGGLLFAHVPFPHPPGVSPGGNLAVQYAENLARAKRLIQAMVQQARASNLPLQFVVFSDHPLRVGYWCTRFSEYRHMGCGMSAVQEEHFVPLIVAGDKLPSLVNIETNAQVFELVHRWP